MKSATRRNRALLALEVMKRYVGITWALNEWLVEINAALPEPSHINNTKELSQMFRYLDRMVLTESHPLRLQKYKCALLDVDMRSERIYYTVVVRTPPETFIWTLPPPLLESRV